MTPARVQRVIRRLTLVLAAAGGFYLYSRFSLMVLPEAGCTPLIRFAPGTSLLLDKWPAGLAVGDAVLFESAPGVISLGSVAELRDDGAAWIETDAADCPAASSAELGWIAKDRLAARVIFAANW